MKCPIYEVHFSFSSLVVDNKMKAYLVFKIPYYFRILDSLPESIRVDEEKARRLWWKYEESKGRKPLKGTEQRAKFWSILDA